MIKRSMLASALGITLMAAALPGMVLAQDDTEVAEGIPWSLSSYAADGAMVEVSAEVEVSLSLDAGEVLGELLSRRVEIIPSVHRST